MSAHPAELIIEAIRDALMDAETETFVSADNVYVHRTLPLNDAGLQLPAISVNYGEDRPAREYQGDEDDESTIESLLQVECAIYARENGEEALRQTLLRLRTGVQNVVLRDLQLGLDFVLHVNYGGASTPITDGTADRIAGALPVLFVVQYEMQSVIR